MPDAAVVTYLGSGNAYGRDVQGRHRRVHDHRWRRRRTSPPTSTHLRRHQDAGRRAPARWSPRAAASTCTPTANNVQITDNVIVRQQRLLRRRRSGSARRTPRSRPANAWNANALTNTGVAILHNQIRDNGGTNLAGGIGIFDGSTATWSTTTTSAATSPPSTAAAGQPLRPVLGAAARSRQPHLVQPVLRRGRRRHDRRRAHPQPDRALGRCGHRADPTIDAQPHPAPTSPTTTAAASGFLQAGTRCRSRSPTTSSTDNISAHEGGGIALDDATNVNIVGNTVTKNITTATAVTSNGQPAPAGLSTAANSDQLQARLRRTRSPTYSRPHDVQQADVCSTTSSATTGRHLQRRLRSRHHGGACPTAGTRIENWDMGVVDVRRHCSPRRTRS